MLSKYIDKIRFGKSAVGSLCKNFLLYYNRDFSESFAFGLAESYYFSINNKSEFGIIHDRQPKVLLKLCRNLNFFVNHFVSDNGVEFVENIRENLFVKRYPFIISFTIPSSFLAGIGEKPLQLALPSTLMLFDYDEITSSILLTDGFSFTKAVTFDQFAKMITNYCADKKILEWFIHLPPVRIPKINVMLPTILLNTARNWILSRLYIKEGISAIQELIRQINNNLLTAEQLDYALPFLHADRVYPYRDLFIEFLTECAERLNLHSLAALADNFVKIKPYWEEFSASLNDFFHGKITSIPMAPASLFLENEEFNFRELLRIAQNTYLPGGTDVG